MVNDSLKTDTVLLEVKPSAKKLWQSGQHEAALILELKKTWLDEWEHNAKTTSEKYQLSLVLKRLQQHYPNNALLLRQFKRVEGVESTFFPIKSLLISLLFTSIIGAGGYYLWNKDQSKLSKPLTDTKENLSIMVTSSPKKTSTVTLTEKTHHPIEITLLKKIITKNALLLHHSNKDVVDKKPITPSKEDKEVIKPTTTNKESQKLKTSKPLKKSKKTSKSRSRKKTSRNKTLDELIKTLPKVKPRKVHRRPRPHQRTRNTQKCDPSDEDIVSCS